MIDFATLEQASKAALIAAYDCGHQQFECGGVIFRYANGRYVYTPPATGRMKFALPIAYVETPPGARRVADYHNHICNAHNWRFAPFFSASDAYTNDGFHIVGYMLDGCSGTVHRYSPGEDPRDDEEVDLHGGRKIYLTIGHITGWIPLPSSTYSLKLG